MTTNVAAVRVPTPNADTAANARTEGRGLQNPERGFTLTLSNFEGPFDLLLTLISRRKTRHYRGGARRGHRRVPRIPARPLR